MSVALAVLAGTAACGSGGSGVDSSRPAATVWLCRPGQASDPCTVPFRATAVAAGGSRTVQPSAGSSASKVDCFYVYPTVSTQAGNNSNLTVQPSEIDAAIAQASPLSQVCRVWAPMYRQRTVSSLADGLGADAGADLVAYDSLLAAWRYYLAHFNDGRPVVFIGHSQGAAMLIRLLASQVDPSAALRARTVLAILAGGNVTVPIGKTVGATFQHLPLCSSTNRAGCVIAYSSFPSEPPHTSAFGRPGQGVSLQSGQTATAGLQVACVNPAAVGGGSATLTPYFLTKTATPSVPPITTPWVTYPALYTSTCRSADGASWLQVATAAPAGRPVVTETLGADWGYHIDDINLALGNLLHDVAVAERAFRFSRAG
jgi:Protein of unknown function (DUF3089)